MLQSATELYERPPHCSPDDTCGSLQVKDGDWVGVTVSGVAKPTAYDAVAIYLQDPADPTIGLHRLIKYKWANGDSAYLTSGKTSFRSGTLSLLFSSHTPACTSRNCCLQRWRR